MLDKESKLLIVDDNEEILIAIQFFLEKHFSNIEVLSNPNLIPNAISKQFYDVYILDMNFSSSQKSGNEGLYWMQEILKEDSNAIIIFITAYADIQLAVKSVRKGAMDFIPKPWENKKLLTTILTALELRKSKLKVEKLNQKQQHLSSNIQKDFHLVLGESNQMKQIHDTIKQVAPTEANILILGENGSGKEVIARKIHHLSARSNEVFINVDLGAISETLFESELFGHEKGAFTGAHKIRAGRLEIASGGTLFLDEIGNLSLPLQAKLLSALQNREIRRIGSNKAIPINIRLISATNMDLSKMLNEGLFRDDLMYRINTIQIELAPLRERLVDIPILANYFLKKYQKKYKKEGLKINSIGIKKLQSHQWPGNVRELQHSIEKAIILNSGKILNSTDFNFKPIVKGAQTKESSFSIEENEKELIKDALKNFQGNLSKTAKELGITRATLYHKMKKYEL